MKQAAVFVFLVALVCAERASPAEKNTRRGRQYEHFAQQGYNGGDGLYQGQEVAYQKVYQHHHGSPQEVQYQNPNIDLKRYKPKEIQLPAYEFENNQNQAVPLEHFQHPGSYDFQYENQVGLQFGDKGPATFNLEYVPITPSPQPVIYPSFETAPSPLPGGVPEKPFNIHVVPLKHAFAPEPNPFPIPERFIHKKLLLTKALSPLPHPVPPTHPPPPPPPPHVTPVKSVGFKLNLLKPILHGSLPASPAPVPSQAAYHQPPPPEHYFLPEPVVTKVPLPPPPPPKKPSVAPLKKFITFFKKFKLS